MKDLLFRKNQYYLNLLKQHLEYISQYYIFIIEENREKAQALRNIMALKGTEVNKAFLIAGVNTEINYGSHALGHYPRSIVFEIPFFINEAIKSQNYSFIGGSNVLPEIHDYYLVAIGQYEKNKLHSFFNIINPFYRLRQLSNWIVQPFIKLFNTSNNNFIIKLLSICIQGMILIGTIRPILKELGYSKPIVTFIQTII